MGLTSRCWRKSGLTSQAASISWAANGCMVCHRFSGPMPLALDSPGSSEARDADKVFSNESLQIIQCTQLNFDVTHPDFHGTIMPELN